MLVYGREPVLSSHSHFNTTIHHEDVKRLHEKALRLDLDGINLEKSLNLRQNQTISIDNFLEQHGDIFQAPSNYTLGHCVSQDFKMVKGIAAEFFKKLGGKDDLVKQMETLETESRCIYLYLIFKHYYEKPT
ncbi:hypothetical protein ILUMI_21446 [Ignelater luminosus]|uniref:Uncharacterized protein n=1 Tax=Ignelater luminosus TaxID=2038154 RepID=A0A8K0CC37_IGNLU|nr:hypothetical protein ILUMI_21446 [Ignelater luminosus]